jgi:hypothetical protein
LMVVYELEPQESGEQSVKNLMVSDMGRWNL